MRASQNVNVSAYKIYLEPSFAEAACLNIVSTEAASQNIQAMILCDNAWPVICLRRDSADDLPELHKSVSQFAQ